MYKRQVKNSAAGTASHMPVTPIMTGRSRMFSTRSTNVRIKEIIAEVFPSENAVNMEEAKILTPANM